MAPRENMSPIPPEPSIKDRLLGETQEKLSTVKQAVTASPAIPSDDDTLKPQEYLDLQVKKSTDTAEEGVAKTQFSEAIADGRIQNKGDAKAVFSDLVSSAFKGGGSFLDSLEKNFGGMMAGIFGKEGGEGFFDFLRYLFLNPDDKETMEYYNKPEHRGELEDKLDYMANGDGIFELGGISAAEESASEGAYAINPSDGVSASWGTYQLNGKSIGGFMKDNADIFQPMDTSELLSGKWGNKNEAKASQAYEVWKKAIDRAGGAEDFHAREFEYIKKTHFDKLKATLVSEGVLPAGSSPTIDKVIWSISVQHGPAGGIEWFRTAFNKAYKNSGPQSKQDLERVFIKSIYESRNSAMDGKFADRYRRETNRAMLSIGQISSAKHYEKLDTSTGHYNELSKKMAARLNVGNYPHKRTGQCGEGVGDFLIAMGFEGMPTEGRSGRKWDTYLSSRPGQFEGDTLDISKPLLSQLKPGAILVYNEGPGKSADRQIHGHVEIYGGNEHFYYGVKSGHAGGSTPYKEGSTVEEYMNTSRFTGTVYYPTSLSPNGQKSQKISEDPANEKSVVLPSTINAYTDTQGLIEKSKNDKLKKYQGKPLIQIDTTTGIQKMYVYNATGAKQYEFTISSAIKGNGNQEESEQTPTGFHRINKSVEGKKGEIIRQRTTTGTVLTDTELSKENIKGDEDNLTSIAMYLSGLEQSNMLSNKRGIAIHGTDEEDLIGTPSSHGCIRMKNDDIITLFNFLKTSKDSKGRDGIFDETAILIH